MQVGEARALYNMGNVFHAKGKQQLWGISQDPGELPPDVRDTLQRATAFYESVQHTHTHTHIDRSNGEFTEASEHH